MQLPSFSFPHQDGHRKLYCCGRRYASVMLLPFSVQAYSIYTMDHLLSFDQPSADLGSLRPSQNRLPPFSSSSLVSQLSITLPVVFVAGFPPLPSIIHPYQPRFPSLLSTIYHPGHSTSWLPNDILSIRWDSRQNITNRWRPNWMS